MQETLKEQMKAALASTDDGSSLEEKPIEKVPVSRGDRPTGSIHFGDTDFEVEDEVGDATWGEVFRTCCCHTPREWGMIFIGSCAVILLLYFFLFALELLGSGAKVMSGCKAGALFGDQSNPISGVMIGLLATVLLQSSSTTTSIIVSLVPGTISVKQSIYMVMGANIGTSVTNTIVAMGQVGDADQLERAFAGATVHDMFNFMTVAILLPTEVITGYLYHLSKAMIKNASTKNGNKWEGPIKKIVSPLSDKMIISNKKLTEAIAQGVATCDPDPEGSFYPIYCEPGDPTYSTCPRRGLIDCDKSTNACPAFFQRNATAKDDKVSGGVIFFIAILILFTALIGLVTILQWMLLGMSTRIVYKATDLNGYIAIVIGCGITVLVQSSSITTSTLTPLVGMGALRLEQMFPLTLGANLGTTLSAIMAAMVSSSIQSLQTALCHLFFNVTGVIIFYPIPFMRALPLHAARQLGKATRVWRGFPVLYIAVMFFGVPMLFLGVSAIFERKTKGLNVLGSFLVILLALIFGSLMYWMKFRGGREACHSCMRAREEKRVALKELPHDMKYVKETLALLIDHTGLVVDDEDDVEKDLDDDDEEEEEENGVPIQEDVGW